MYDFNVSGLDYSNTVPVLLLQGERLGAERYVLCFSFSEEWEREVFAGRDEIGELSHEEVFKCNSLLAAMIASHELSSLPASKIIHTIERLRKCKGVIKISGLCSNFTGNTIDLEL